MKIASLAEQLTSINAKLADLSKQKSTPRPGPAPAALPPAAAPAPMPGPATMALPSAAAPAPMGHRGPGFISLAYDPDITAQGDSMNKQKQEGVNDQAEDEKQEDEASQK